MMAIDWRRAPAMDEDMRASGGPSTSDRMMPRFIAFLRAINVGGHTVAMHDLRELFEDLGFKGVETFIASGNVIFVSPSTNVSAVQKKIERHLHTSLGYEVHVFVRTDAEVAAIAGYNPFPASQLESAATFCVAFFAEPLDAAATRILMSLRSDVDDFHVNGREVYWISKNRQSESTFSNGRLEKLLKARATFRGAKTVAKLAAKYPVRR
jgi:uncharacterized protein (DUF1697 family)